jgi:hypothetical protein
MTEFERDLDRVFGRKDVLRWMFELQDCFRERFGLAAFEDLSRKVLEDRAEDDDDVDTNAELIRRLIEATKVH